MHAIPPTGFKPLDTLTSAAKWFPFIGQGMQAVGLTVKFERGVAELGDFVFYYGNPDKGFGGVFDKNNYWKGSVS